MMNFFNAGLGLCWKAPLCGNYDGDDEYECGDYNPDEDLEMMFDEEDLKEMREG